MADLGRKKSRETMVLMDALRILASVVIMILSIFAFLDPEGHRVFFPIIFALASALNFVAAKHRWQYRMIEKSIMVSFILNLLAGIFLVVVAFFSLVSM